MGLPVYPPEWPLASGTGWLCQPDSGQMRLALHEAMHAPGPVTVPGGREGACRPLGPGAVYRAGPGPRGNARSHRGSGSVWQRGLQLYVAYAHACPARLLACPLWALGMALA